MERIAWYRTPVDGENLKVLTKRSTVRGLLQAGSFFLLYFFLTEAGLIFFLNRQWVLMVIACYIHSVFTSFLGTGAAMHELSHGTPFRSKRINEVFNTMFGFLTWTNQFHFRISHMRHHQYTMHRGLDKEVIIEPDPYGFWDYFSWFTFDVKLFLRTISVHFAHFIGNADADFYHWDPLLPPGHKDRKKIILWARVLITGHAALIVIFILSKLWVLIYLISFSYFFATFLNRATGIIQHHGLPPNIPDWRISCHTVILGPVLGYLYWRMNYHTEHHMYAAVPFFQLKNLHRLIEHDIPVPEKGIRRALLKIHRIHKRQRREPGYWYYPELPKGKSEE